LDGQLQVYKLIQREPLPGEVGLPWLFGKMEPSDGLGTNREGSSLQRELFLSKLDGGANLLHPDRKVGMWFC
jgi:hypothetical protein